MVSLFVLERQETFGNKCLKNSYLNTVSRVLMQMDGWMLCEPIPDNSVECYQWTNDIITHNGEHYVKALWGEDFRTYGPCQAFAKGDYICRSHTDHTNVWVVRKKYLRIPIQFNQKIELTFFQHEVNLIR